MKLTVIIKIASIKFVLLVEGLLMTDNITKRLSKIRETLDGVYDRLKDVFLTTSVLKVVREYAWRSIDDIELWALFCATLDFQVPVISWLIPMLSGLLRELEHKRIKFIDIVYNHDLAKNLLTNFKWYGAKKTGFSHRFIKLDDILKFFKALKQIHSREGSIGNLVCRLYNHALNRDSKEPIVDAIKGLARCLRNELKKAYGDTTNARTKISRFIPDPDGKSAMKRLCLYFRWMTRGYPDLGLWDFIDPQHLLVSLDVGVIRVVNRAFKGIMKQLGISIKENATLDMAIRVTCFLRHVNSEDPAKYDYVLSRPSIMGYCVKQSGKSKCYLCPIYEICESSRKLPPPRKGRHPLSEREKKDF